MIEAAVLSFALILARVSTCVAVLPVFGTYAPRLVKVGLAVSLSVLWFGGAELPHTVAAGVGPAHWPWYLLALGRETLVGALLGYALGLFLVPARIAGEFIGQEMGLALAATTSGTGESPATVVGQIVEMLAVLIFLGLDGHHLFLAAIHGTFARWPIGVGVPALPVATVVAGASWAQQWGLLIAAPLAVCLFLTTLVLALLTRVAPQLNVFSVGLPLQAGVGLGMAVVLLPGLVASLAGVFGQFQMLLQRFL